MPGQLPTSPAFATLGFGSVDPTQVSEANSGRILARKIAPQRWRVTARYPELKRNELRALVAFLYKQRGQYHTYTLQIDGESEPDGSALGVPVVRNRVNLFKYSEQIDVGAAWFRGPGLTVAPDAAVAPDGTVSADELVPTGLDLSNINQRLAITAGLDYTISIYAKAAVASVLIFSAGGGFWTDVSNSTFNLATGVASGPQGETMHPVGNGWYRCSATRTAAATHATAFRNFYPEVVGVAPAGRSVYVWGGQAEQASSPSGYLPTTEAAIASQPSVGETLYTSGWTASQSGLLLPADKFKLAGGNKVYAATDQVDADAWGNAAIPVYPPLNRTPANGESVVVSAVPFTVRHTGETVSYDRRRGLYTLELDLIEDVG